MTTKAKAADAPPAESFTPDAQYRVTLKEAIRVGGLTLRPDGQHRLSGRALEANRAAVDSYEQV